MRRFLGEWIERLVVVLFAASFAMIPHFFEAYTQRLGGHAAELQIQVTAVRKIAQESGQSLSSYIAELLNHQDEVARSLGEFVRDMVQRCERITMAYQSMLHSRGPQRLFTFLTHVEFNVFRNTLEDFQLGISFTLEAGIYACFGAGIALLLKSFALFLWKRLGAFDHFSSIKS